MSKKFDIEKFRQNRKKEEDKKALGGRDPKYLNYFDLKENETLAIRFLPDAEDSSKFYVEYDYHSYSFDDKTTEVFPCAKNHGERCPACRRSWEYYNDDDKKNAGLWRAKTKRIAQCVVIDSPLEDLPMENGSIIKLLNLSYNMWDISVQGIMNGTVENPLDFEDGNDFIIKKTIKGGNNQYDKSYWKVKTTPIPEEILTKLVENPANEFYDLTSLLPKNGTAEEVQEWMDKIDEMLCNSKSKSTSSNSNESSADSNDNDDDDNDDDKNVVSNDDTSTSDSPPPKKSTQELLDQLRNRRK